MGEKVNFFWFRRDLRLHDNRGLFEALKAGLPVLPVFIFDREILDELEAPGDARVEFIYNELKRIDKELISLGSGLMVAYGLPEEIWAKWAAEYDIETVFTNHDYEPYARERDADIATQLKSAGVELRTFKDQVIFEKEEILSGSGTPYTVFTPYSKKWKAQLSQDHIRSLDTSAHFGNILRFDPPPLPRLQDMGFEPSGLEFPSRDPNWEIVESYHDTRNYPAQAGTSRLSLHLRFGTVSIRKLVQKAVKLNETWLNELIWREFYQQILWNFPHVVDEPFRAKYKGIPWRDDIESFEAWCQGKTGYPIVDAGMRELNETGFMHNRVRMITASFLTKHLLIDWRWGEAYFAKKLLDFDLASNNGGWQWAAGCGTDAAPYFRIFNPESQTRKFDSKKEYIRRWVPEFGSDSYPDPIVDHKFARERCLSAYKNALDSFTT